MTPTQREAALRLAEELARIGEHGAGSQITTTGEVWHPANTMLPAAALLRELAAEPVQGEPVAWWIQKAEQFALAKPDGSRPFAKAWEPLYAAPQQRQPLSDEQIDAICRELGFAALTPSAVVRAVEAAHGITGEKQ